MATFKDFPAAQKAASFTLDQALEKMSSAATGGGTTSELKAASGLLAGLVGMTGCKLIR
jgi:hypothetical protein